jgi:5-methyltetrahydropteroyltriglutamate--homocysteine methyltransferase
MFETAIAGSLPKPAWLAETGKLWPKWKAQGDELRPAKADATLLWIKLQEDAGLDVVGDGEQSTPAFRARLPGAGGRHRLRQQGGDGHPQRPLQGHGAAGGGAAALKGRVHAFEAQPGCAPTRRRSSSSPCPAP